MEGSALCSLIRGARTYSASNRILVTNADESVSVAPSVPSPPPPQRATRHSAPECPKFIPAPPPLAAADVAAQQLRVQFAEQLDVVGHNARLRAFRESSEEIHRREQPLRRERVASRHHIQLPMQLLDEQQRVIIPTCGRVTREAGEALG